MSSCPSASGSPVAARLVAFWARAGAFGWVGLYLVAGAEVGGPEQAGLRTGVAMTSILAGILMGAPLFGLVLEAADSFTAAWVSFALLSIAVAGALAAVGNAIQREGGRSGLAKSPEGRRATR